MPVVGHSAVILCDVGTSVVYRARACKIARIESFDRVVVQDDVTGEQLPASPHDLRLLTKGADPEVRNLSERELKRAVRLTALLLPFVDRRITAEDLATLKRETKLGKTRIYECLEELRASPCPAALVRNRSGFPKGRSRLSSPVEAIVAREIHRASRKPGARTIQSIFEQIELRCVEAGLSPPSIQTVRARIAIQRQELLHRRRRGKRRAIEETRPLPGTMRRGLPLDLEEIDHSPLDIILVDSQDREPIGRAQMTLVMDAGISGFMGFHLGIDPPSLLTTALAFTHAVLPKEQWLIDHDLPADSWPLYGLPKNVRTDRAAEFKSIQFTDSCKAWGIEPHLRKKKEDGGIIERGIEKIQACAALEDGATGSDPKKRRGEPDPSRYAHMTIKEAESWLAREITQHFHYTRNDELGMSANQAWRAAHSVGDELRLPPIVANQKAFLLSFLPWEMRLITHEGVRLFKEKYYSNELLPFVGNKTKYKVHYDPRRLGRIYIEVGQTIITVPYADPSKPCLPKFELDARRRRQLEAFPNEYDRTRRVAHNASQAAGRRASKQKTREARRKERLYQASTQAGADIVRKDLHRANEDVPADYSRAPKVSSGGVV